MFGLSTATSGLLVLQVCAVLILPIVNTILLACILFHLVKLRKWFSQKESGDSCKKEERNAENNF